MIDVRSLWRNHPHIAALGPGTSDQLLERYPPKVFDARAQLSLQGAPVAEVWFLLEGAVLRTKEAAGREILSHILEAPAVFGDAETLRGQPHSYNTEVLERAVLVKIDADTVLQLLADYPELAKAELRYLSGLYCLQGQHETAALGSLVQRVANVLVAFASCYGWQLDDGRTLIDWPLSLKVISRSVGGVLRSVDNAMADLRRKELVERRDGLLVVDVKGLQALAGPILGGLNYHAEMNISPRVSRPPSGGIEMAAGTPMFVVDDEMIIGSACCDLTLTDSRVSPRHARIFRSTGHRYWVQDLESAVGTLVNGKAILRTVLQDGDRITLGETDLVFHVLVDEPDYVPDTKNFMAP